jgi:hypothetical protein
MRDDGKRTVWTMFNGVTEILKGSPIWTLPKRTTTLHRICDDLVGIDYAVVA